MELEVGAAAGAEYGEKSRERLVTGAERTFQIQHRAFVAITSVAPAGDETELRQAASDIAVENTGQTPAEEVESCPGQHLWRRFRL